MVTTTTTSEQRAILNHISWQTCKTLLEEIGEEQFFRTWIRQRLEQVDQ